MKEDVVSKEKLMGSQLVVQSYLDELLQEATIETQYSAIEPETSELDNSALPSSDINDAFEPESWVTDNVKKTDENDISAFAVKLNETVNERRNRIFKLMTLI